MATYRQLINRTLIALGEDTVADGVSTLTDKYHLKIAQFMNDILEQVEDAAQWRVLRARATATVTGNGNNASLSLVNERSRLWYVHNPANEILRPLAFDVTDTSDNIHLGIMDTAELLRRDQANSNKVDGNGPNWFSLLPSAEGQQVYVFPRTATDIDVEIDMIIPQGRLTHATADALDTNVKVPNLQVVLGTVWLALDDRGEELGSNVQRAMVRYQEELAQQVAAEHAAQGLDTLVAV